MGEIANGDAVKGLGTQIGLLLLATLAAGVCCALGFGVRTPPGNMLAVVLGAAAALPAGIVAILVSLGWGSSINAVILSTLVRPGLSLAIGCGLAAFFPSLWGTEFFITLGAAYLAGLSVETWLTYDQMRHGKGVTRAA